MNELSAEGAILVAYDGSPHSEAALEWAAATATLEGRSVRAVSVAEPRASADRDVDDDLQRRFEAVLAAAGADGTFEELAGDVEAVLLEQSRHAHVLVAGTRGRGRTANTLLGSVSQHLARHTPCPLIVVRPPANPAAARIVAGVDGSLQSIAALRVPPIKTPVASWRNTRFAISETMLDDGAPKAVRIPISLVRLVVR